MEAEAVESGDGQICPAASLSGIHDAFYHATSQAFVVQVENHRLARCHRALRLVEHHPAAPLLQRLYPTSLIRLAIARLCHATKGAGESHPRCPVQAACLQGIREQPGVIVPLTDDQHIALQILGQYVPGVL